MKAIGRAVVVLVGLCVFASGMATGQDAPSPEAQEAVDRAEQDIHAAEKALRDVERTMKHTSREAMTDVERELLAARVQLEARERAMDKVHRQLEQARSDVGRRYGDIAAAISLGGSGAAGPGCLVIPSGQIEASELEAIVEDMTVMQRILDKELEREFGKDYERLSASGPFSFTPGPAIPQSIYLDGYGVLFLASVKFPVAAPPPTEQAPEKVEEPGSRWEQTRRELYGGPLTFRTTARGSGVVFAAKPSGRRYDRDEVEKLEQTLLAVLREAANIRNLRPDDSIAIAVFGAGSTRVGAFMVSARNEFGAPGGFDGGFEPSEMVPGRVLVHETGALQQTVLTIHVQKALVDSLAEGELSMQEFRQRATITAFGLPSAGSPGGRPALAPEMIPGMMPGMPGMPGMGGFDPMAAPEAPSGGRRAR
jgi:hypothetical protein